jgi:SAM-dependent methyltransferase
VSPAWSNLAGAARAWREAPELMDYLRPDSPIRGLKLAERAIYLSRWARWLPPGCRVLDLGGGIGRFATWLLDRGCEVELVDADPQSVEAALRHAAGRPGRFRAHVGTAEVMPPMEPFDVVLAAELLCYLDDPAAAVAAIRPLLRPGGVLLASVEARFGWALALDAPDGGARGPDLTECLLGDLPVHVPGDRHVRTFSPAQFSHLLHPFFAEEMVYAHFVPSGPFERIFSPIDDSPACVERILAAEERFRQHTVLGQLGRSLLAVAREP